MTKALFPGSFDPVTNGHVGIIKQAAKLFDQVDVLIMTNTAKHYLFSPDERVNLVEDAISNLSNVQVIKRPDQLTVNVARQLDATVIVRGVRNTEDFLYEQQIAAMNKVLAPEIETILLFTQPQESFIASSIVKEVARFEGEVESFLPATAARELKKKMRSTNNE
ncbi:MULTISPECIES: pantetheine-phosphate adenylyltransferase [unclassified Lactobacillus]|uniref:pantetheine-phosphate adenylyltransferase n=1 Tax=unclassified Lactobacillus TaxID=2620435 RepID=UPI000EFD42BC|nr:MULTISPECIES: pantetheine-phosphate adenylyltransferase [unclassified Lactobacillus]RMC39884.1 pantetheine-phosphate adenylyltransferase [Lactobacillus sp. ESL0237]RMC44043.1 pantetheine-phosphate adenylyltransferase [Lactobacillus sp. ESL0234]RMC45373.1 pantetheine-phosphate adenylyltransferase [Lactobacillus sp. ESL0236]RMC46333.1 pantetheine-phosphate adenylyltransferase [Lactobacillus sp. ESL0230]RMC50635.1 pantetheine-phosphate adenylyltransferase [Lactobacillus sp. ESL0225]